MDSSLSISHSKGGKISKNLKLFGRFQNSWLTTESNWWLKQFNIWLRRWLAETCSVAVAPHNSDLFGQCNYPSQATGERPSDQLAQWLVSCKYPDKVKTAVSDHWPSQTQPSWIMVEPCLAPAQAVMTERGIRDSQEPDLADSRSSVKLNLARGAFCWHHKNGRQTGAKMVNTERVWQDWRTLRVI